MAITTVPFWHLLQDERLDTTSCATYFDKSGVMKVSTVNLVTQSQEFWETEWSKTNVTVDANFIPSPFNPTSNAEAIVNSNGSGNHYVSNTVTFADNTVYCHSVYAQRYSVTNIVVAIVLKDGTTVGRTFDLINGTDTPILDLTDPLRPAQAGWATQPTYHGIEYVAGLPGEEWYRCWVAHNVGTGATNTNNIRIYSSDNYTTVNHSGDGNMYFLWGDKVEIGTSPTDYNRTETVPCSGARIDYDPVTLKSNGMMIEEQRTNLLTYSEQFDNAAWVGTVTRAANAVVAPDGTTTGDTITTVGASDSLYQSVTVTASTTYTFSLYVKLGTISVANYKIAIYNNTGASFIAVDVVPTPEPNTSSWTRITYTFTTPVGCTSIRVYPFRTTGAIPSSTVSFWGAQLEAGAFPTSYVPSTTTFISRSSSGSYYDSTGVLQTAGVNVARINHNPADLTAPGKLLLEGQRTNLLTYSEQFDNAAWVKTVATVTANDITAPDGTVTGDKLVETAAAGQHVAYQTKTITSNTLFTASSYLKAGERTRVNFRLLNAAFNSGARVTFDLSNGTVADSVLQGTGSNLSFSITSVGNGWYRCSVSCIVDAATISGILAIYLVNSGTSDSYTGDGTSGLYVWGAQLEAGAYPTSYIATTTASVTRAADVSSSAQTTRATDRIRSFNGSELYTNTGTYVIEAVSYNDSSVRYLFGATDAIDTNKVVFVELDNNDVKFIAQNISSSAGTITPNQPFRLAYGFTSGDQDVSLNHSTLSSGVTLISSVSDHLVIGADESFGNTFNGYIRRIIYFDTKFQDSVIQQLSAL